MKSGEFCRQLGIDETALQELLAEDLPWHGDEDDPDFDDSEVATWLVEHGKAEVNTDRVARNIRAAAKALSIGASTLHRWTRMEGFPGRPGYYPIEEIRDWDEAKEDKSRNQWGPTASQEKEDLSIKEQRDLLKLNEERGLLIEVSDVKRMNALATAYAVAELNLIAGKFESRVPAGTDPELVAIMRDVIIHTVRECCTILSEAEMDFKDDQNTSIDDEGGLEVGS